MLPIIQTALSARQSAAGRRTTPGAKCRRHAQQRGALRVYGRSWDSTSTLAGLRPALSVSESSVARYEPLWSNGVPRDEPVAVRGPRVVRGRRKA